MSQTNTDALARAHELIEQDNLDAARALLGDFTQRNPSSADGWWLYAHAVDDPLEARRALDSVLSIDPAYPGAEALKAQLRLVAPDSVTEEPAETAEFDDELFGERKEVAGPLDLGELNLDDERFDLDDLDADELAELEASSRRRPQTALRKLVMLGVILLLVLIGVLILLSTLDEGDQGEELAEVPTSVAQMGTEATEEPFIFVPPEATEQVGETDGALGNTLIAALNEFDLASDTTRVVQTDLGNTEIATVCASINDLGQIIDDAMMTLADDVDASALATDAVALEFVDCTSDDVLNIIGVSSVDLTAFRQGALDDREYRRAWQVLAL
ncbi:MAG: hypothetical protein ACOCX5_04320 [Chloroflexota bacterium]